LANIFHRKISLVDKIMFTRNLAVMIGAGLALNKALETLKEQVESQKLKFIIGQVAENVQSGKPFSESLSHYPEAFSNLFVNMVRIGETAGNLEEVLNNLADQMKKDYDVVSRVRGALMYPGVIMCVMVLVGYLMMILVVPQLSATFKELGGELPASTKFVIWLSENLKSYWYVFAGGVGIFIYVFRRALKTETGKRIFDSLKVFLLEHEIDFNRMDKELILYKNFIKILDVYGIDLAPPSLHKIWYYMKRDYVGYGKLDVLLKDPMIEDISCDGADISVYLYHRKYTNIETNVVFEEEELNMTILKLAQISGKSISTGYPIMNARLPDGSRLEATLGREVTTRGGTITIRKFREEPFTPADLIKYGTFNTEVMAYLWLAVENNKNIIIVGETAAGKTTTLNAISLFIPSESKVITIEDTRELTLYHKNWIPATIRETYMGQEAANIDMFDLLRSALRQRPEFLLVGEIRGKEAYTLFQAMSTGHTTFSTMHAGSIQTAVNRLLSEPINVPLMMLSSLDIMIIQVLRNVGRRRARRVNVVSEFVGINAATGDISTRELYKWNPLHDVIELGGSSNVLDDIMIRRGWSKEQIIKELENRKAVLQYMVDMDINDYRDVSVIIRRFADSPEEVMDLIREGKTLLSEEHEHK